VTAPSVVSHPAPYSPEVIEAMATLVRSEADRIDQPVTQLMILDPMAGIGGIHDLPGRTFGVELEPEWAEQHPDTRTADARHLPFKDDLFHVIGVSPAYGNRMADHHDAQDGSRRVGYKFSLGRMPSDGSSTVMHYGQPYRDLHVAAWIEATRVLVPGGLFILNCKDFIRQGKVMNVSEWHLVALFNLGYRLEFAATVGTPGMRFGANRDARVDGELVIALRAPG
jgi:hypothetical protein